MLLPNGLQKQSKSSADGLPIESIEQILADIKVCQTVKEAAALKETVLHKLQEIKKEKARIELQGGDYIDGIKVREVKYIIKSHHKALKRVKKKIRSLKKQRRPSMLHSDSHAIPPIDEILKAHQLFEYFEDYCSATRPIGRPNYCKMWTEIHAIEQQTWAVVHSSNNAESPEFPFDVSGSQDSLATNLRQDSCPDMTDFYDMDDITVPLPVMQKIKSLFDCQLTPQFWTYFSRKSCVNDPQNTLESDVRHLRDRITKRIQYVFASPMSEAATMSFNLVLNDLEPLWKLRDAILEELEMYEFKSFSNSSMAAVMLSNLEKAGILPSKDDAMDEWNVTNPEPEKKKSLYHRKWSPTKLHAKKGFKALNWLNRDSKRKTSQVPRDDSDEDEYIKSFIIPLKDDEDTSSHPDMVTDDDEGGPQLAIEVHDVSLLPQNSPIKLISIEQPSESNCLQTGSRLRRGHEEIESYEKDDAESF
ncbi:hypothetical protein BC830DRAFT_8609 [Chytriomyces sp. MP71]|nr:hypothetical protein BC830DRAFT_8609 [Chytriomyces sp. MP71]